MASGAGTDTPNMILSTFFNFSKIDIFRKNILAGGIQKVM